MSDSITDFITRLISLSNELTEVYRQHLLDQGELLPHVLMGEITRLVVTNASPKLADWLPNFLKHLEAGLKSNDDDIANLIAVSFVENLLGEEVAIQGLLPLMGPCLREEVKIMHQSNGSMTKGV